MECYDGLDGCRRFPGPITLPNVPTHQLDLLHVLGIWMLTAGSIAPVNIATRKKVHCHPISPVILPTITGVKKAPPKSEKFAKAIRFPSCCRYTQLVSWLLVLPTVSSKEDLTCTQYISPTVMLTKVSNGQTATPWKILAQRKDS